MSPMSDKITTHRQMRTYSHELLHRNVVDAASRLLVQEGSDALTAWRIAQELECSTTTGTGERPHHLLCQIGTNSLPC